jgi:hypothetical protein
MQLHTNKGNFSGTVIECAEWLEKMQPAFVSVLCCEACGSAGESIDDSCDIYTADALLVSTLEEAEQSALLDCSAQSMDIVEEWRADLAVDLARVYDVEHVASERVHAGWTEWRDASGVIHRLECEDGAFSLVWSRSDSDGPRVYVRTLAELSDLRADLLP